MAEAIVQVNLAMGDIQDQKAAITAQENIKTTWEEMLAIVTVQDRNQPLETIDYDEGFDEPAKGGLWDPNSPVVAICLYIYQI